MLRFGCKNFSCSPSCVASPNTCVGLYSLHSWNGYVWQLWYTCSSLLHLRQSEQLLMYLSTHTTVSCLVRDWWSRSSRFNWIDSVNNLSICQHLQAVGNAIDEHVYLAQLSQTRIYIHVIGHCFASIKRCLTSLVINQPCKRATRKVGYRKSWDTRPLRLSIQNHRSNEFYSQGNFLSQGIQWPVQQYCIICRLSIFRQWLGFSTATEYTFDLLHFQLVLVLMLNPLPQSVLQVPCCFQLCRLVHCCWIA